jgi:hypothetical protein
MQVKLSSFILLLIVFFVSFNISLAKEKTIDDVFKDSEINKISENSNDASHQKDIFSYVDQDKLNYDTKAKIIILNKITANSREFLIDVGGKASYGRAEVTVHKCAHIKGSNEDLMLVSLYENLGSDGDEASKLLFKGWIFSNSLSISAVEHPIYQLIAAGCYK